MAHSDIPNDNNPATRLYRALTQGKAVAQAAQGDLSAFDMWGRVFGHDPTHAGIHRSIASLLDTLDTIQVQMRALGEKNASLNVEKFLKPLPAVRRVLEEQNLAQHARGLMGTLNEPTMLTLSFTAEKLGEYPCEPTVPEETLKELAGLLAEVETKVAAEVEDVDLRRALVYGVHQMRGAIAAYQVMGAEELRKGLTATLGGLFVNRDVLPEQKKRGTWWGVFARALNFIEVNLKHVRLRLPMGPASLELVLNLPNRESR